MIQSLKNKGEKHMKRSVLVLAAVALCLGLVALAADDKTDLSGTWVLDKQKSDPIRFGGRGGPGGGGGGQAADIDITLVVKQADNELAVTRKINYNGQERSIDQKFTLDGSQNTNPAAMGRGELKSKTKLKKDKLIIEGTQQITTPNGDMEMGSIEEYSLSEDGKILTIKATRSTPMGERTSKQVFNKQ